MFLDRWKQKITESAVIVTEDGRHVFYPYDPYKGYVLPKRVFERLIVKSVCWYSVFVPATFAAVAGIGALLNIDADVLVLVGLFDYAGYHLRVRRITKRLIALPADLSVRVYALSQPSEKLRERFLPVALLACVAAAVTMAAPARAVYWILSVLTPPPGRLAVTVRVCADDIRHRPRPRPGRLAVFPVSSAGRSRHRLPPRLGGGVHR